MSKFKWEQKSINLKLFEVVVPVEFNFKRPPLDLRAASIHQVPVVRELGHHSRHCECRQQTQKGF
jgi:hypothetical protein